MEASTCHNMRVDNYTLWFLVSIVTSKMELFGTGFKSFYFLSVTAKNSILDVASILDSILLTDIFALHSWIVAMRWDYVDLK